MLVKLYAALRKSLLLWGRGMDGSTTAPHSSSEINDEFIRILRKN